MNEANHNKSLVQIFYNQWDDVLENKDSHSDNLDHVFEKIKTKIKFQDKARVTSVHQLWQAYKRIAAVLLIPIVATLLFYSILNQNGNHPGNAFVEIIAPEGSRVRFILPDSTIGWLNSGAKLRYSTTFMNSRKVHLTGEAYFDVKHLNESNFKVATSNLEVEVLGTKFNVSDYKDESFTDIILAEGLVKVSGVKSHLSEIIKPNQRIRYDKTKNQYQIHEVNADRLSLWRKGYLILDNEPLEMVIGRIERRYNVNVQLEDDRLKSVRLKATFVDEPLEEVLRLIAISTPIQYTITDNDIAKKKDTDKRNVLLTLKQN